MIKAKRYKMGNKYSKHLYLFNDSYEDDGRILDTNIEMNNTSPNNIYEVFTDSKRAYIVEDNIKIYLDYTSDQILRYFGKTPVSDINK